MTEEHTHMATPDGLVPFAVVPPQTTNASCSRCGGHGHIHKAPFLSSYAAIDCPRCAGTGIEPFDQLTHVIARALVDFGYSTSQPDKDAASIALRVASAGFRCESE